MIWEVDRAWLVRFVRQCGLAVLATRGPDGAPQAALVGVAATDQAEIVFDTSVQSRKYRNITESEQVALVIGWDDEITVQCEGTADVLTGEDRCRCLAAYFAQYPDGRERAQNPDIAHIRTRPGWVRRSDYRPDSFGIDEMHLQ
jgi:pyridoxine/pyridoxamine 5'-phosphate oxidase